MNLLPLDRVSGISNKTIVNIIGVVKEVGPLQLSSTGTKSYWPVKIGTHLKRENKNVQLKICPAYGANIPLGLELQDVDLGDVAIVIHGSTWKGCVSAFDASHS